MHKQTIAYSYNEILLNNKKKPTADKYTNMEEFESIMNETTHKRLHRVHLICGGLRIPGAQWVRQGLGRQNQRGC